eukprot:scaffold121652_cov17-Tisochrysis_lutea.AAC.2
MPLLTSTFYAPVSTLPLTFASPIPHHFPSFSHPTPCQGAPHLLSFTIASIVLSHQLGRLHPAQSNRSRICSHSHHLTLTPLTLLEAAVPAMSILHCCHHLTITLRPITLCHVAAGPAMPTSAQADPYQQWLMSSQQQAQAQQQQQQQQSPYPSYPGAATTPATSMPTPAGPAAAASAGPTQAMNPVTSAGYPSADPSTDYAAYQQQWAAYYAAAAAQQQGGGAPSAAGMNPPTGPTAAAPTPQMQPPASAPLPTPSAMPQQPSGPPAAGGGGYAAQGMYGMGGAQAYGSTPAPYSSMPMQQPSAMQQQAMPPSQPQQQQQAYGGWQGMGQQPMGGGYMGGMGWYGSS